VSFTARVDAVIDAAIGARIVGCAVQIQRKGQPVYRRIAGFADREAERKVSDNEIFRLASCTKPIVAATALRMLDAGSTTRSQNTCSSSRPRRPTARRP
jgi:CubicO group peptidase (beta-lactamase class C family)